MDITEMLKSLGESLADYTVAKHLEEIGRALDDLADKTDDLTKKLAYGMASANILELALKQLVNASEKLQIEKDEDD